MKKINFFTLFYIDIDHKSLSGNGIFGSFEEQMTIFVQCCEVLNKSLKHFSNNELTVLTNNSSYINKLSKELICKEIPFEFKVPKDIKYFAAHRKIDALKYMATLNENCYSFLIDSDIICINNIPPNLMNCIQEGIPVYYDITDMNYPAYGREVIIKDKEILMPEYKSTGIWAGGEFIGGDNHFFKQLHEEILNIKDSYLNHYTMLHHQGDEMLVSVALEKMMREGYYICDAGDFDAIGRYWSFKTQYSLKKWKDYKNNFLIHVPGDKNHFKNIQTVNDQLVLTYERYLKKKSVLDVMRKYKNMLLK